MSTVHDLMSLVGTNEHAPSIVEEEEADDGDKTVTMEVSVAQTPVSEVATLVSVAPTPVSELMSLVDEDAPLVEIEESAEPTPAIVDLSEPDAEEPNRAEAITATAMPTERVECVPEVTRHETSVEVAVVAEQATPAGKTESVVTPEFDTVLLEPLSPAAEEVNERGAAEAVVETVDEVIEADEASPAFMQKEATPEPQVLVDISDPSVQQSPAKSPTMDEITAAFKTDANSSDLLILSTGSRVDTDAAPAASATTSVAQPVTADPPVERRPKSAARRHADAPVEKKSFRPTSKLAGTESKGAPAPARLTTNRSAAAPTASSKAKAEGAVTASTAAVAARDAQPRVVSKSKAPTMVTASKPAPPVTTQPPPTSKPSASSSLFKPTAATAARAAATAAAASEVKEKAKEKEPVKELSRPGSAQGQARAAPAASAPKPVRRAGGAFGSTAASRAREAALPPIKRQRLKLTAPQESFRPGRSGANKSKAAILGEPAPRPRARAAARVAKPAAVETFPLPGPSLRASMSRETSAAPEEASKPMPIPQKKATLEVPSEIDLSEPIVPCTPGNNSLLSSPVNGNGMCISPASSRHTERSDISRTSASPSRLKMPTARPLDPVLTPTHSANVSAATTVTGQSTLIAPPADSPAVMHVRRVSGIPSSLKKAISEENARRKSTGISPTSSTRSSLPAMVEDTDEMKTPRTTRRRTALREQGERIEDDEPASVVRHDVSTPTGKASLLLSRLHEPERKALTPRDANASDE